MKSRQTTHLRCCGVLAIAFVVAGWAGDCLGQTASSPLLDVRLSRSGIVHTVAVQSDGSVIVGGEFTEINGVARSNLARLTPDGNVDATWNPAPTGTVKEVIVDGDWLFGLGGMNRSHR